MSNYSPIIAYGPKDVLAHLDPTKALKGVQIDAELNAIAAAIATKYDAATLPSAATTFTAPQIFSGNVTLNGTTTVVSTNTGAASFGALTASQFISYSGTSGSAPNGTPVTLKVMPGGNASYIVTATLASANDVNNYTTVGIVSCNVSTYKITIIQPATLMGMSMSGGTLQGTQGSGATQGAGIAWTVTRIA